VAYAFSKIFKLGSNNTGLALEVQLKDATNVNSGVPITTNFYELGNGEYAWYTAAIPDDFRGWGVLQKTAGSVFVTAFSINPEELEYTDIQLSDMKVSIKGVSDRDLTEVYDKVLLVDDLTSGMPMRMIFNTTQSYAYYYNTDADAEADTNRVYKRKLYTHAATNPISIAQLHGVGKIEAA
jgi:hypothetical protein